jgi:hypothetical protein
MIILEIILQKAIPLPEGLKHLSQTWEKTQTNCHEIYSTTLDYCKIRGKDGSDALLLMRPSRSMKDSQTQEIEIGPAISQPFDQF